MFGGGTFNGSPSGLVTISSSPATAFSPGDYRISVLPPRCLLGDPPPIYRRRDTGARVDMYSGSTLLNQVVTATFTLIKTFGAPSPTVGSKMRAPPTISPIFSSVPSSKPRR